MSGVDFLEISQEEEMELVTQVKKLEDTNNLLSSSLDGGVVIDLVLMDSINNHSPLL
jgi:hypothetical protein